MGPKDYKFDMNFDETDMKRKLDHSSNDKVKLFHGSIVFIEEEWFADMNLTDGSTFIKP